MNWKQGNAGQLSLLTTLMNVAGCIARTFTSIVLTQVRLVAPESSASAKNSINPVSGRIPLYVLH